MTIFLRRYGFHLLMFVLMISGAGTVYGQAALREAPIIIPQPLHVGDRARLILRPEASGSIDVPLVVDAPDKLPETSELRIYRIELEIRPDGPLVLIDFSAYVTGEVDFPEIEIGGYRIRPSPVQVDSVLRDNNALLSAPAEALSAPGTQLLLYSLVIVLLSLVLGFFLFIYRILPRLKRFLAELRSHRAFRLLKKNLQKLDCSSDNPADIREALEQLNSMLRIYLSSRFGTAFLSHTAAEINKSMLRTLSPQGAEGFSVLFGRIDVLRFGTLHTKNGELCELAAAALSLAEALEQVLAEKARTPEKEARS